MGWLDDIYYTSIVWLSSDLTNIRNELMKKGYDIVYSIAL